MSITDTAENTVETFVDDYSTTITQKYTDYVFSGFDPKKLDGVDSALDEALEGALQTLKFSIMNQVSLVVTEYAMTKLILVGGYIVAYVKAGRVSKIMKSSASKIFNKFGKKGRAIGSALGFIGKSAVGDQNERIALSSMANDTANNITNIVATERQTQFQKESYKRNSLDNALNLDKDLNLQTYQKNLEQYNIKMKTGTWKADINDKKLFMSCVPTNYTSSLVWNLNFINKLNQFTEFAKDSENKITNLAQTHLDLLTTHNISKVK
jgi:hypothetical protein